MDTPDPRRGSFWEAYRACVEENRVRPDRSPFYMSWAKDFHRTINRRSSDLFPIGSSKPTYLPPFYFVVYKILQNS
jgi:hypothetical protein